MAGFRNCGAVGQRVGLRMTLTRRNCQDLDSLFDFIEREGIQRACFYHLVYSGRGNTKDELTPDVARDAGILVRDHGFRLIAAGVMDMFPHTTHVEAMAVFTGTVRNVASATNGGRCHIEVEERHVGAKAFGEQQLVLPSHPHAPGPPRS